MLFPCLLLLISIAFLRHVWCPRRLMNKFCNQGSLILLSLGLLGRVAVGCERLLGFQMLPATRIIIRRSH